MQQRSSNVPPDFETVFIFVEFCRGVTIKASIIFQTAPRRVGHYLESKALSFNPPAISTHSKEQNQYFLSASLNNYRYLCLFNWCTGDRWRVRLNNLNWHLNSIEICVLWGIHEALLKGGDYFSTTSPGWGIIGECCILRWHTVDTSIWMSEKLCGF